MTTIYLMESDNGARVATRELSTSRAYLESRGYTQKQPEPDPDPLVECWWRDGELIRVVPVDLY